MNRELKTKYIKDEGIVIATKDFGEADKILTTFTKNFGKLEILAKNVKKLNSRRLSACELLSHNKFLILKSAKIDTLIEAINLDQFLKIKTDLAKIAISFEILEILNLTLPLSQPHPEIFSNLTRSLKKLSDATNFHEIKVNQLTFEIRLLKRIGFLGEDFKVKNFPKLSKLDEFVISRFEEIAQRQIKSNKFVEQVLQII